ncbi:glutamyl-tRNA reductase [Haloprofundus marisrubri]|uniref:Glutamyl-tRNA reductase n=1 Tax=Haloprofundus marisrubri TaxID=1514971 RepID=A0A0W1R7I9_9EURY|nr:glutamyl-tRNA reductase [Haloprofundus marisrubri]KTG09387.1 glutamyl-tRNA reductase [Haloprofundus marisrubri]
MEETGVISGVSVSHVNATVDEVEAACHDDVRTTISALLARDGVEEAYVIQTCNRAEAYVVTERPALGAAALSDFAPDVRDGAVVTLDHEASLRHLMRVAAGLESLVLGEDQILGQLRRAESEARAVDGIGTMLEDALRKAIHVGERARTETRINEGAVSLGSAAVRLADTETTVEGSTALVVGAGEMGTLAARALDGANVERLLVANRTVPHAEHIAAEVEADASAVALDAAAAAADEADVVITATSSTGYVLDAETLADAGETVLVDIAQPRDVDPAADDLPGVVVRDIDALETVTAETRERRRSETDVVEAMIDDELARLLDAYKRKRADDAISAMYESAEAVKHREVQTALSKLDAQGEMTDEQRETVEALADALVGQLLAAPTKSLRDAAADDDWTTIQTAMQLFDPEFGTGGPGGMPPFGTGEASDAPDEEDVPSHVFEQYSDD